MRKMTLATLFSVFLAVCILATPASAGPITIDFSGVAGAVVSFTPAVGNSLDITGAPISLVSGFWHSSKDAIVGGALDVVTGGCVTGCKINKGTGSSLDFFEDGGSLEIFGGIPKLGIAPGTLLLKGYFDSALTVPGIRPHCSLTEADLAGAKGGGMNGCVAITDINSILLEALGFSPTKTHGIGYMSQMFLDVTLSLKSYTGKVMASDIILHPIAEPATLALMGVGLLFLGGLTRKIISSR